MIGVLAAVYVGIRVAIIGTVRTHWVSDCLNNPSREAPVGEVLPSAITEHLWSSPTERALLRLERICFLTELVISGVLSLGEMCYI